MDHQNHVQSIFPAVCVLILIIGGTFRNRKKILMNLKSHPVKFVCLFVGTAFVSFSIFAAIFFGIALKV